MQVSTKTIIVFILYVRCFIELLHFINNEGYVRVHSKYTHLPLPQILACY